MDEARRPTKRTEAMQPRWQRIRLRGRRSHICFRSSWQVQISPSSAPPSNPHPRPPRPGLLRFTILYFTATEGPSRLAPSSPSWEHSGQREVRGQWNKAGNDQKALYGARACTCPGRLYLGGGGPHSHLFWSLAFVSISIRDVPFVFLDVKETAIREPCVLP